MSLKELAHKVEITYEHARRIVRGLSIPSRHVLKAICSDLELDFDEINRTAERDRLLRMYGDAPSNSPARGPACIQLNECGTC